MYAFHGKKIENVALRLQQKNLIAICAQGVCSFYSAVDQQAHRLLEISGPQ